MDSFLILVTIVSVSSAARTHQPHILLILADDMGFNDASFRGSIDIPTPNIDALAYAGRILDRHYVLPICTPSRTALLTGLYPVRTGMQGFPLKTGEKRALPAKFTLLPQYLKTLNYSTHLIGKWHQGFYHWSQTPTYRGFDSFFGYYNGMMGYFDHDINSDGPGREDGIDLRRDRTVALDLKGLYATELFTSETETIIRNHNKEKPLFIELSHLAVHSGKNGTIVEVESEAENNKTFWYIQDPQRRRVAGAMTALDKSVGRVVKALAHNDMIKNTIIVFIADNGGETLGLHANAASNYPLRGQKATQFEGGVRGAAVVWHASMEPTDKLHSDYVHMTDWIPTFYEAAGGDVSEFELDGVSQWGYLMGKNSVPPRTEFIVNGEFLVEGEDTINKAVPARSYIDGPWKLVWGILYPELSGLEGESGITEGAKPYDLCAVINSKTMETLLSASNRGKDGLASRAQRLRELATLPKDCRKYATNEVPMCDDGCLFNIHDDPCETRDLSAQYPDIVFSLKSKLQDWETRTVPQLNTFLDPASNPRYYNGTWMPWEDVPPYRTDL